MLSHWENLELKKTGTMLFTIKVNSLWNIGFLNRGGHFSRRRIGSGLIQILWDGRQSHWLCPRTSNCIWGLQAKIVIFNLQGWLFRWIWACDNKSHCSHWSSMKMVPDLRCLNKHRRNGASPCTVALPGPKARSVPRQAITNWIILSGNNCCKVDMTSLSRMVFFPTRGVNWSIWSKQVFHSSEVKTVVFPLIRLRFISGSSDGSTALGIDGFARKPELRDCLRARELGSWDTTNEGSSKGLLLKSCNIVLATLRANFRGYISVNFVRAITWPWYTVLPSMRWCSWLPGHTWPCRWWYIRCEVVRTCMLFLSRRLVTGSWRSPITHMSNCAHLVCW